MSASTGIKFRNGFYGFLCIGVSLYALSHLFHENFYAFKGGSGVTADPIWRIAFHMHFIGGAVALGVGWTQFLKTLRKKRLSIHRKLGNIYVLSVIVVSGPGAMYLALFANGGFNNVVGFSMMALCWFIFTVFAYKSIRKGDTVSHGKWMIRSFAVTLAAVSLRLLMPIMIASGVDPQEAYQTIAWLCWVPNLFVAEWIIQRPSTATA